MQCHIGKNNFCRGLGSNGGSNHWIFHHSHGAQQIGTATTIWCNNIICTVYGAYSQYLIHLHTETITVSYLCTRQESITIAYIQSCYPLLINLLIYALWYTSVNSKLQMYTYQELKYDLYASAHGSTPCDWPTAHFLIKLS